MASGVGTYKTGLHTESGFLLHLRLLLEGKIDTSGRAGVFSPGPGGPPSWKGLLQTQLNTTEPS